MLNFPNKQQPITKKSKRLNFFPTKKIAWAIPLAILLVATLNSYDLIVNRVGNANKNETFNLAYRAQLNQNSLPQDLGSFVVGKKQNNSILKWSNNGLDKPKNEAIKNWKIQPPHNVYLFILSNWGVIGFIFSSFFVWSVIKIIPRLRSTIDADKKSMPPKKIETSFLITIGLLVSVFLVQANLDHFLVSLPEGVNLLSSTVLLTYPQLLHRSLGS